MVSSPSAPLSPQLHHLGPAPLRVDQWEQKRTLRDPPQQLFHLADEITGGGCGLLGITLQVLVRERVRDQVPALGQGPLL